MTRKVTTIVQLSTATMKIAAAAMEIGTTMRRSATTG
jgi:hypothetical protein